MSYDDAPDSYQVIVEDAPEEDEACPCCNEDNWLRGIHKSAAGVFWMVFCGGCGKSFGFRWNPAP